MQIELYNSETIESCDFSAGEEGEYARVYLLPMMREGTKAYIGNVETELYLLKMGELFLPISVNEEEYHNSYVVSPYGVLAYAEEEARRLPHFGWLLTPLVRAAQAAFKRASVNRTVFVNNWLLSTNLYPSLTADDIARIVAYLQRQFPSHTILWRSVNTSLPKGLIDAFRSLPCRLLFSRQCYLFDPKRQAEMSAKQRWNIKADSNLIRK